MYVCDHVPYYLYIYIYICMLSCVHIHMYTSICHDGVCVLGLGSTHHRHGQQLLGSDDGLIVPFKRLKGVPHNGWFISWKIPLKFMITGGSPI